MIVNALIVIVMFVRQELERSVMQRQSDVDRCTDHYQQLSAAQHTARVEHKFRLMHEKWDQIMSQLRLFGGRSGLQLTVTTHSLGR